MLTGILMYFQSCHIPYQIGCEADPRICAVSSGITFLTPLLQPPAIQPPEHLGSSQRGITHLHCLPYCVRCLCPNACVCLYTKHYMKYWKAEIQNAMSWGFLASIMVTSAICVTWTLTCWPYLSQMLSLKEVSSLFWPLSAVILELILFISNSSPLSWWLVFFPALFFSAQFFHVLPCLLGFFSFLVLLLLGQLSCL